MEPSWREGREEIEGEGGREGGEGGEEGKGGRGGGELHTRGHSYCIFMYQCILCHVTLH